MRRYGRLYDRLRRALVFVFSDAPPEVRRQTGSIIRGEDPHRDGDQVIETVERHDVADALADHDYALDPRQAVVFTESIAYYGAGVPGGVKRDFRGQPHGFWHSISSICRDLDDNDDSDAVLDQDE